MSGFRSLPQAAISWLEQTDRQEILAVDSHTAGNPTRIVLSGIDLPTDVKTVDAARLWLRNNADYWRRRLVHEPRGGGLTCAVLPIATQQDGCAIGAVIMEPGSYPPMCGHCMIGFGTVIAEMNLLPDLWKENDAQASFSVRTPAGPVGITVRRENGRIADVTLKNVASFVVMNSECQIGEQTVTVDLLYGGDYYISVDAEKIGLSLDRDNATNIVQFARKLAAEYTCNGVTDPLTNDILDVYQVLFYNYDSNIEKKAKIVVVAPPGVIDRSPCGTGTSAFFAKLVTEGRLNPEDQLSTYSIIGSRFTVTSAGINVSSGRKFVTPAVTGQAYINGFLLIAADEKDSLADGFSPL